MWSNFWVSCDPQPCLALPSLLKILIPHYIFQAQVRGRKCRRKIKKSGGHEEIEDKLKENALLLVLQKLGGAHAPLSPPPLFFLHPWKRVSKGSFTTSISKWLLPLKIPKTKADFERIPFLYLSGK